MSRLQELIALAALNVQFGQLQLQLDVHNGEVRAVNGTEHMEKHYPGDGYADAIMEQQKLLQADMQSGKSGVYTFSYEVKGGKVKRLFAHRQFKHLLTDR